MKIVILDAKTLGDDVSLLGFEKFGEVKMYQTTSAEQTRERVKNVDIVVTNKVVIDRATMKNSSFKLIVVTATGVNNVDIEAAREFGIEVKNAVGYSTDSVVGHTFNLAFYLIGQTRYYDDFVKCGAWSKSGVFTNIDRPFFELAGKKWGIIGLGTIGKKVANIASSFGCEVSYYSTSGVIREESYKRVDLDELLLSSDIISIHAPLNAETKNLLGENNLTFIKSGAVLLNLGRGGIIDESALAKVIDENNIYVGLDVTEVEPIDSNNPLLKITKKDNLIITPHIAWTSKEARERLVAITLENIQSFENRS